MLYVGVGNRLRRDDGLGPWVADALRRAGRRAVEHAGDGTGLIDLFRAEPAVTLIDASQSGAPPGTITRLDALHQPLAAGFFRYSTHRFGLAEAVETARALGCLPEILLVCAVEGQDFSPGEGLTPPVARAGRLLARALLQTSDAGAPS